MGKIKCTVIVCLFTFLAISSIAQTDTIIPNPILRNSFYCETITGLSFGFKYERAFYTASSVGLTAAIGISLLNPFLQPWTINSSFELNLLLGRSLNWEIGLTLLPSYSFSDNYETIDWNLFTNGGTTTYKRDAQIIFLAPHFGFRFNEPSKKGDADFFFRANLGRTYEVYNSYPNFFNSREDLIPGFFPWLYLGAGISF